MNINVIYFLDYVDKLALHIVIEDVRTSIVIPNFRNENLNKGND